MRLLFPYKTKETFRTTQYIKCYNKYNASNICISPNLLIFIKVKIRNLSFTKRWMHMVGAWSKAYVSRYQPAISIIQYKTSTCPWNERIQPGQDL